MVDNSIKYHKDIVVQLLVISVPELYQSVPIKRIAKEKNRFLGYPVTLECLSFTHDKEKNMLMRYPEQTQSMSHGEREALKRFVLHCECNGDIDSLSRTLVMIAHWFRQGHKIGFNEYASQWTEAQKNRTDGNASTEAMRKQWPFSGKRCIGEGMSGYYPQGIERDTKDIETEVRHAITKIKANYYHAGYDGLLAHDCWHEHEDPCTPFFIDQVSRCIEWLKDTGLYHVKVTKIACKEYSSYWFKHVVEQYYEEKNEISCYTRLT